MDVLEKADDGPSSGILFSSTVGGVTRRVVPCSNWCTSRGDPDPPPQTQEPDRLRRVLERRMRGKPQSRTGRGTLILHKKYGVCTGGGFDRKKQTISLHDYWTNKRLTQGAKIEAGRTDALGWHGAPGWSLTTENGRGRARGATHPKPQSKERLLPPTA